MVRTLTRVQGEHRENSGLWQAMHYEQSQVHIARADVQGGSTLSGSIEKLASWRHWALSTL